MRQVNSNVYSAAADTGKLLGEALFIFIKRGALRIVLKWDFLGFDDQFVIFFSKMPKNHRNTQSVFFGNTSSLIEKCIYNKCSDRGKEGNVPFF